MDTTLMPWFAGILILFVGAAVYFVTKAKRKRNRPGEDEP